MKISYEWLNEYFDNKLPKPEKISELLTMHSMEVEGIEKVGNDTVIDVKTLPNNNHSCLCHRGIAREIGVLANIKPNLYSRNFIKLDIGYPTLSEKKLEVKIEDGKLCRRYIGRIIENINVGPSPIWLKEKLETLGQKSINNIVDATNFIMLEIGQPMHIFDMDKIKNMPQTNADLTQINTDKIQMQMQKQIFVKNAIVGQKIITLDKKEVDLDENVLLITDGINPLAIAGIKGGNFAELDMNTKNIILESANFDPVLIRKTAQKIKIQTDASKRYENDLNQELCGEAMDILTKLIIEIAGTSETKIGEIIDNYSNKAEKVELGISAKEASLIIGIEIKDSDIEDIFNRFVFVWKKIGDKFVIDVPTERLDLRIKEDLAEEIGRVYGYEKINDVLISKNTEKVKINKSFAYKEKIRRILYEEGFSEVINYSFADKGEIEIANPVSPEKKFLRTNLTDGIKNSLEFNTKYLELIDVEKIKIFEFGHIFKNSGLPAATGLAAQAGLPAATGLKVNAAQAGEESSFAFGIKNPISLKKLKESEIINETIKILSEKLNIELNKIENFSKDENVAEFNFEKILEKLPEITEYDFSEIGDKNKKYKKISVFPFIIRDIAVFTPEGTKAENVFSIILKEAGELMIKSKLFDVFTKNLDGIIKTSYAYRLIFQSYNRTLTDDEINAIMIKINQKLNENKGWQVR
ncbi:MAG: phenylalanine--tRNA ligase subunit beta [bacterium]